AALLAPGRRKRVVGLALRHGHIVGVAVAFTLGSFPWPLLVRRAEACGPAAPVICHYHTDQLGSTQMVTDLSGAVVEYVRSKPSGEVRGHFNAGGNATGSSETYRYEFTGHESELISGLQYFGSRFYDPLLGMFLTHDPAHQFSSPYAYGPWSPMNGTDPG